MNNKFLAILSATMISGALSGMFFYNDTILQGWGLSYGPGIFFGVTTGVLFMWLYKTNLFKSFLWLSASILCWYLALQGYLLDGSTMGFVNMISAGVIGSALLGIFFWAIIKKISWLRILFAVAMGGSLAVVMMGILQGSDSISTLPLMISFAIWQFGVGFALVNSKEA